MKSSANQMRWVSWERETQKGGEMSCPSSYPCYQYKTRALVWLLSDCNAACFGLSAYAMHVMRSVGWMSCLLKQNLILLITWLCVVCSSVCYFMFFRSLHRIVFFVSWRCLPLTHVKLADYSSDEVTTSNPPYPPFTPLVHPPHPSCLHPPQSIHPPPMPLSTMTSPSFYLQSSAATEVQASWGRDTDKDYSYFSGNGLEEWTAAISRPP